MCSIVFLKLKMECEKKRKNQNKCQRHISSRKWLGNTPIGYFQREFSDSELLFERKTCAHTHVLIFEFHINKIVNCLWHSNFRECPIARARSKSLFLSSFCFSVFFPLLFFVSLFSFLKAFFATIWLYKIWTTFNRVNNKINGAQRAHGTVQRAYREYIKNPKLTTLWNGIPVEWFSIFKLLRLIPYNVCATVHVRSICISVLIR